MRTLHLPQHYITTPHHAVPLLLNVMLDKAHYFSFLHYGDWYLCSSRLCYCFSSVIQGVPKTLTTLSERVLTYLVLIST